MSTRIDHEVRPARSSFRPAWRWLLSALALPPAGYLAHGVVGAVDAVAPALLGGAITGAIIGAVQWALLRHRRAGRSWIVATTAGYAAGLAAGAALVGYGTDRPSLVVMGAVTGLVVGMAQGRCIRQTSRAITWTLVSAALFPIGWLVASSIGVNVAEQWTTYGISGALTVAFAQSTILDRVFPASSRAVRP